MSTYVLKSWKVASGQPLDQAGTLIHLTGRRAGIVAWLLSLAGIDPTCALRVDSTAAYLETGSVFGNQRRMMPLYHLTAVTGGLARPIVETWFLFSILAPMFIGMFAGLLGGVLDLGGFGAFLGFLLGLAAAVGAVIFYYRLNKRLSIQFTESSGASPGIMFKPSLIEGVDVNEAAAANVTYLIDRLVLGSRGQRTG